MNLQNKKLRTVLDFVMITVGSAIAAFAIEEFLAPNTILDGGVIGVGMMISNLTPLPLSILTFIFNIPFLIIGSRKLGLSFIAKSAYAMIVFSLFVQMFEPLQQVTDQYLLAVCFGGVIDGIGVGLVIRFGGCLDGTETVAILMNRKFNFPVGQTVLVFNVVIYVIAGVLFGFDRAMYSLLTYFVVSKALDIVETGLEQAKAAMIITNEGKLIAETIYQNLGRTVTFIEGEGLISGKKSVLYCVLNRIEIFELRRLIKEVDASAFIAVSDVSEIIGTHIKKTGKLADQKGAKELELLKELDMAEKMGAASVEKEPVSRKDADSTEKVETGIHEGETTKS